MEKFSRRFKFTQNRKQTKKFLFKFFQKISEILFNGRRNILYFIFESVYNVSVINLFVQLLITNRNVAGKFTETDLEEGREELVNAKVVNRSREEENANFSSCL